MWTDDWLDRDQPDKAGFASLADVSLRRPAAGSSKKSDITDTLKSMRAVPEFVRADAPVDSARMRDVTPSTPSDILAHWNALRADRPLPSRDLLRVSDLVDRWPDSILFRCDPAGCMQPDPTFATAMRARKDGARTGVFEGAAEISALLSQWILSVARNTVQRAAPQRDSAAFDTPGGQLRYHIVAMPFGTAAINHVLCYVEVADRAT